MCLISSFSTTRKGRHTGGTPLSKFAWGYWYKLNIFHVIPVSRHTDRSPSGRSGVYLTKLFKQVLCNLAMNETKVKSCQDLTDTLHCGTFLRISLQSVWRPLRVVKRNTIKHLSRDTDIAWNIYSIIKPDAGFELTSGFCIFYWKVTITALTRQGP